MHWRMTDKITSGDVCLCVYYFLAFVLIDRKHTYSIPLLQSSFEQNCNIMKMDA